MEQKLQNRYGRWGRALSFALALALAALLTLTALPLTGSVYADNEGEDVPELSPAAAAEDMTVASNSLTITLPEKPNEELEKLAKAGNLEVDLYLVAKAVKLEGYNVYQYEVDPQHTQLAAVIARLDGDNNWTVDGTKFRYTPQRNWDGTLVSNDPDVLVPLAQELTNAIFTDAITPAVTGIVGTPITGLSAGLYIALPHGKGLTTQGGRYAVMVGEDKDEVASLAVTENTVFNFAPQLISLPGLTEGNDTADPDPDVVWDWEHNVAATAKPGSQPRYASLALTKALSSYNGPATFTFRIRADYTNAEGKPEAVEKLVNFQFGNGNSQTVTLDGIFPAGSKVTVKEAYSGVSYKLSSWKQDNEPAVTGSDTITIDPIGGGKVMVVLWADRDEAKESELVSNDVRITTVGVTATNAPTNTTTTGGGVVNHFDHEGQEQNDWNGWRWTNSFTKPGPTTTQP